MCLQAVELLLQSLDQCRLVNHRAARHVDEDAVRPKRFQHLRIDKMLGAGAARRDPSWTPLVETISGDKRLSSGLATS